ncbi:hypothetical protein RF11_02283 [Thelohanellus kitauei]|uniref:Uncharacterized protein n=1 Tax=Thelohanellus kitauei TaxID=669202 RepID=A0A0C2I776_THEKT|nr:hypothetical protein RF11_01755 [Thelohanellus kitauei]KII63472.1 hypothetical protein RF11_02283 [Thelohanellus kitauei]
MKLENEQKLFMYEDLKSHYLSIIKDDFMKNMFDRCGSYLRNGLHNQYPENNYENDEYKRYKRVLAAIIGSFNDRNYLDRNTSNYYMRWLDEYSSSSSQMTSDIDDFNRLAESMETLNLSSPLNIPTEPSLKELLKWFTLIYEFKFIFGDISCKFTNLNFV